MASVFSRQAEGAAEGIEKLVLAALAGRLPILFGRGESKSQQVAWSRENVAAHAQAKGGACE